MESRAIKIVIIGGGMCGLLGGMLLAEDGHEVTVLERDSTPPPEPTEAWATWDRGGVRQFRLGHYFLPPFRATLDAELPRVNEALAAAGAFRTNPIDLMPETMSGGRQDGDDRFEVLTGSRPMVEAAIARCAAETNRLTVQRGTTVKRLLTEEKSTPVHVRGVETESGDEIIADLVVDASGRNSALPRLLTAAGATAPVDESDDSGFVYYGRAYRSPDGELPASFGGGLQHYDSVSTLTLPADNNTWAIAFVASGKDKAMRRVRESDQFDRLWRSYPLVAHWLDGELVEDTKVMGNLEDRIRSFVVDGAPVATGVVAVGDSWAATNPSVGRGASMGLHHVLVLRDLVREADVGDRAGFVSAFHRETAAQVEPFYRETVRSDRFRLEQIEAEIEGREHTTDDPMQQALNWLSVAAFRDPDLVRLFLDYFMMNRLADEMLAEPGVMEKVQALGQSTEAAPGPSRSELEEILAG